MSKYIIKYSHGKYGNLERKEEVNTSNVDEAIKVLKGNKTNFVVDTLEEVEEWESNSLWCS